MTHSTMLAHTNVPAPVRAFSKPRPVPTTGRMARVVNLESERQKRLVAEYGPLVERLVRQSLAKVRFRFTADELRSAAWVGLFEAHRRYDSTRGIPFAAFAQHRVAGAILDEVRGADDLSRPCRRRATALAGMRDRLTRRLQREPTNDELARVAGEDLDTFHRRSAQQRAQSFVHLDDVHTEVSQRTPVDATLSALDSLCEHSSSEELASAMRALPERHQQILAMYYREEKSYREIGAILGVTESRICQIIKGIHSELRERMQVAA